MANRLSNEELRKSLQEYGEDVGPITPTTRSTLERRLLALRKARGPINNKNSALNAFSSDDSEIENASTTTVTRKKRTFNRSDSDRLSSSRPREINSSPDSDIFKKPAAVHVPILSQEKRATHHRTLNSNRKTPRKSISRNSTFDVETSDSDFDSESSFSKSPRLSRKPLASIHSASLQGVGLRRTSDEAPSYNNIFQRRPFNSTIVTPDLDCHRFSPTSDGLSKDHSSSTGGTYQSNGYLSSNGDFAEEKGVAQGSSTNYSHCVSWFLLLGAVTFFIVIGLVYMTEVQKTTQMANKNYSKFCSQVPEEQCKSLIFLSRELHYLLTTVAGAYECGSTKTKNFTVPEARAFMKKKIVSADSSFKMEEFDSIFNSSLRLFIKNPNWGVRCHSQRKEDVSAIEAHLTPVGDVVALEATQATKSFLCRARLSLAWAFNKLLFFVGVCVLLFVSYLAFNFWKRRREVQEKLFYEMVEKVIDILRETADNVDPLSVNCKAVVNVRDTLIPPKERKGKLWLWDRVVAFIEENESRVSVEYQKINGEDFKVWRWHPCSTPENEGGKQGKVWQGQAFSSLGKSKVATYTPSPCLKIRNMFDPEVEYGNDWQVSVRDAILEKCEGNDGVVHIAFDTSTNNEGCVFMMCSSSEAAGKAYNDLHGWWFDGKLVTVKYLKLSRYLERFPESGGLSEPLKPSNNKRLSLAAPFFSSALERS